MHESAGARTTGLLFVTATVAAVIGNALLERPAEAGAATTAAGAFFELVAAGASAGIAVSMYARLKAWGGGAALGAVFLRGVEAVLYAVGTAASLADRTLGRRPEGATDLDRAALQAAGVALLALRQHAILAGVFAFCAGAGLYYVLLWRARLVPRWLSRWGIVGIALLLAACARALSTGRPVPTYWPLVLPIALQEMVLAGWLLVRGFDERPRERR